MLNCLLISALKVQRRAGGPLHHALHADGCETQSRACTDAAVHADVGRGVRWAHGQEPAAILLYMAGEQGHVPVQQCMLVGEVHG